MALSVFLKIKAPLVLCVLLILISFSVGALLMSLACKWTAYALALIFLGGIIIVFLYISRVALNEKLVAPKLPGVGIWKIGAPLISVCIVGTMGLATSQGLTPQGSLTPTFFNFSSAIVLFLVLYLLRALFRVVALRQSFKGAVQKSW